MDWRGWIPIGISVLGLGATAVSYVRSGGAADARVELRLEDLDGRVRALETIPGRLSAIQTDQAVIKTQQAALQSQLEQSNVILHQVHTDISDFLKEQARGRANAEALDRNRH